MVTNHHTKQDEYMMRICISIVILCLIISACASTTTKTTNENVIVHVVLIWLKESGNQNHMQQIIDISNQLKEISEIQEMQVGRSIPSDRKIVDDSFDVGLYMIFTGQEDMQRYLVHPKHKKAVKTVIKPLASKIIVYDFDTLEN